MSPIDDCKKFRTYNECLQEIINMKSECIYDWWEIGFVNTDQLELSLVASGRFKEGTNG